LVICLRKLVSVVCLTTLHLFNVFIYFLVICMVYIIVFMVNKYTLQHSLQLSIKM